MTENGTKQQILDIALKQFGLRGFAAVSIRDICREVGIKESSLYYHFRNKQDIMDQLIAEFMAITLQMENMLSAAFVATDLTVIRDEDFLAIARWYYGDFLNNKRVYQLLLMLRLEFDNPVLARLYAETMFDNAIALQEGYFNRLIEAGYIKPLPAQQLAVAYQALINFIFNQQIAAQISPAEAEKKLLVHLRFFLGQYKV